MSWEEYLEALENWFGEQSHKDPMSVLLKLRQTSNVSNYHEQFEFWIGRIDITEDYAVSFFLMALNLLSNNKSGCLCPKL